MSIVDLRLASLRRLGAHVDHEEARAEMQTFVDTTNEQAGEPKGTRRLERDGTLLAHVTWGYVEKCMFGVPITRLLVDAAGPEHHDWLRATLREVLPLLNDTVELQLYSELAPLVPDFEREGFGVDTVLTIGDVEQSIAALPDDALGRAEALGLRVAPLAHADIAPLLEIERRYFAAFPQFCWFGASADYQSGRAEMLADYVDEPWRRSVFFEDELVGGVGVDLYESPYWRNLSGPDLTFAPDWIGKGLAAWAYAYCLRAARDAGSTMYRGGTSQLGVLALGARMGRRCEAFIIRKNVHFPRAHFTPHIPVLQGLPPQAPSTLPHAHSPPSENP